MHADLSEYNILYHRGTPYIIDVSQSVEHDHPNALVFLRADCANVTTFFRKRLKLTSVMTAQELFEFVVARPDVLGDLHSIGAVDALRKRVPPALMHKHVDELQEAQRADAEAEARNAAAVDKYLESQQERIAARGTAASSVAESAAAMTSMLPSEGGAQDRRDAAAAAAVSERVFMQAHIPQRLDEVEHVERDVATFSRGDGRDLLYAGVTGLTGIAPSAVNNAPSDAGSSRDDSVAAVDDADSVDADSTGRDADAVVDDEQLHVKLDDRDANRERKRLVKQAQRERRMQNKAMGRTKAAKRAAKKAGHKK